MSATATPAPTPGVPAAARASAGRWLAVAVGALTVLGFAIRVANFDQTLFADELSTYWIVEGRGLGEVLSLVRSDAEITPPLYFVLGWLSIQPDWGPEWVRLPSLLAGTATIPLVYLLGARTLGRRAGLIGAAVITLSPFMIYYSTEARAYAVMIALLVGSTLALLAAIETSRKRWWAAYAACSCLAMLSHYTAAFPLAAQALWALWAHRDAWRPLLASNALAAIAFAPWIPGFVADNESPTTEILSALSPLDPTSIRVAFENWAVGFPTLKIGAMPGRVAVALIAGGLLVAVVAGLARALPFARQIGPSAALRAIPPAVALIVALTLAAPLGELVLSAIGPNVFGARNLNAAWPGLALAIGGVLAAAGPTIGLGCTVAVLAGYSVGAAKTVGGDTARMDFQRAADLIEARWGPDDVVVDATRLTPVPLTGLDVYLPPTNAEYRLGLPVSDEPFEIGDYVPPADEQIEMAKSDAAGASIFLVTGVADGRLIELPQSVAALREDVDLGAEVERRASPRFEVVYRERIPSLAPIEVVELRDRRSR